MGVGCWTSHVSIYLLLAPALHFADPFPLTSVTKSSLSSICNATADAPFKSGMQNATFKFPVKIDTEETTS